MKEEEVEEETLVISFLIAKLFALPQRE